MLSASGSRIVHPLEFRKQWRKESGFIDLSPSHCAVFNLPGNHWLLQNGPGELEQLFRAIVYHSATPVFVTDSDRKYRGASVGAGKLLGLPREKVIGRSLDDFADPTLQPQLPHLWQNFLETGEQEGTLQLKRTDGSIRAVVYTARTNILPVRHVLALREKTHAQQDAGVPSWLRDYALYLLDPDGCVVAWYAGASRMYGRSAENVTGRHISMLYSSDDTLDIRLREELQRAVTAGHFVSESWQIRSDGTRFWANSVTAALKNEAGDLQGFARIVRDFTDRHARDEELRRSNAHIQPVTSEKTDVGIVSGEFDIIPEANDAFLRMLGYSREDLLRGDIRWGELTPPECAALDEVAHEEGLRFGVCTPYEKVLLAKDGSRVPVLITTAVLGISPFRWITYTVDLREREAVEKIDDQGDTRTENFDEMIGSSEMLRRVQRLIEVVAPTDATVLILGETGTGKELVARAVHRLSPRRKLPFVTLNCAAIPTGLLESELFGYERGAFTGALQQKIGRFEMAHKGTLFLDEVGDIPIELQPKLLRALQEKCFERLGGTKTIPIDVRLVAATNRDLTQMMGDKLFRSDLYYRLRVFPITTPPLRDHPEDIPQLVRHFTRIYSTRMSREVDKIPAESMRALVRWQWPGNIRELENFIERSVILSTGSSLRAPLGELEFEVPPVAGGVTLEQIERDHITKILGECNWVVATAATRLGMPRTTLNAMMRKLGISRNGR